MRAGQLLASACFVVLAAAACGTAGSATAGGGATLGTTAPAVTTTAPPIVPPTPVIAPPAGGAGTSTVPVPSGARVPVPAGQIKNGGMNAPPQGVEMTGNDVVFSAEQSGCQVITAQATSQTATQVTIQVITTNTGRGNQMCPMIVRVVPVVAQLNAPLGSRTIVFQAVTKHS
jgi:hypothetical protein